MELPFRQVDVFGEESFSGNPVAVVLNVVGLDPDQMRRISAWSNLSECTFVLPPQDPSADYRVRIFSLNAEIPFAGHPTLGTAAAWLSAGGTPRTGGQLIQECGAGLVPVRLDGNSLAFAAPRRIRSGPVAPGLLADVVDVLGVDRSRVVDSEWLDNGPGWVGVLLDSAETVLGLQPDASRHPGKWDIGVVGPAPAGAAHQFELRAFFTEGVEPLREDPVTGSLNAAAAEWLLESGRATAPYTAHQGSALGRNGRIHISQTNGRIWVEGRTSVAVRGTITV